MPRHALPDDLSAVVAHLEAAYPEEGCGLIVRGPGGFRVQPIENAHERYRAGDPVSFPGSARTAYLLDPAQWLKASLEAERREEEVCCVYHSHCDAGAGFSARDRAWAAPDGTPLLPGVVYLVVAIRGGQTAELRTCWWEDGEFLEADVTPRLNAT